MNRIAIKPQWLLRDEGNGPHLQLPHLLNLLTAVREQQSLTKACRAAGLSYRHAWGLIKDATRIFGVPLMQLTRGQGAQLTALGEKLVWADKRINARLAPMLENVVSELETEIERARTNSKAVLRIHASHGYAVGALRDFLNQRGTAVDLQFCRSVDSLASLGESNCELAGFHIPLGSLQAPLLRQHAPWLNPKTHTLINVITRRQGIMVARGNPKKIAKLADLTRSNVRYVNRQRGSGTRIILELLLEKEKVDARKIVGYETAEFTHDAVAAHIASGMADAGMGVEVGARKFNLDFVPLVSERYFLACRKDNLASPAIKDVIAVLSSSEFKAFINNYHGLDSATSGKVISIKEAFPAFSPRAKHGPRR